jgi:chorismate mutase
VAGDPVIDELRARIAIADRRLLAAVNDRLRLVQELVGEKEARGVAFVDPEQERRLTDALVDANTGPLSEPAVRELVAAVLELTKRELGRAGR